MKTTSLSRSSDFSPQSAAVFVRLIVSQSRKTRLWFATAALIAALTGSAPAQVPQLINYQGRVAVGGVNFEGTGQFRFALVNADASPAIYWLNSPDTTPPDGVPDAAVSLTVTKGLYSVLLGDATLTNMAVMPSTVFNHPDVRLRVWFDDGTANGSQLLSPDQRIAAVGYAMMAGNVPDAAITSAKLAPGAVGAANIAAGAVGSNQLAAGAVTGAKIADGAVGADKMLQARAIASSLVVANPAAAIGAFGSSIAAVGTDRVLVGDPMITISEGEDPPLLTIGAAYLLDATGNLITTIPNPNSDTSFEQFGRAVAGLGTDKVIIGAPEFDAGNSLVGAAYLFSFNGDKLAYIENPTPASDDLFGSSVAGVGDDRMLVGAPGDTGGAGAAYLFNTAIPPEVVTTFANPAPATYDFFGQSAAAVDAGRVLIGANGAAYLFSTNGTLQTTFTNPTAVNTDQFGYALAAVGTDRVLVGAWGADTGATDAGAAYLFSTDGALLATFTNPAPAANDRFGWSVAAVGTDRVLIGACRDDTGATNAGTAYIFRIDGTLLNAIPNPAPAANDGFGTAVAAAGPDRLVIGAPGDDTVTADSGSTHFYQLGAAYVPGLIADGLRAGSITSTMFAPGSVKAAAIDGGAVTTAKLADGAVTVDKVFHQLEVVASNTITNPCVDGIFFGYAVAAAGAERVLISDPEAIFWEDPENPSLSVTGAAYLYDLAGNLMTTIMNPAPFQPSGSHDGFGLVLAAVGLDKVVIGAPWFPHMSERSGAAYLFDHNGNQLAFFEKPTP